MTYYNKAYYVRSMESFVRGPATALTSEGKPLDVQ
jgi:hypothetical protein